jgi:hypothetical protein
MAAITIVLDQLISALLVKVPRRVSAVAAIATQPVGSTLET